MVVTSSFSLSAGLCNFYFACLSRWLSGLNHWLQCTLTGYSNLDPDEEVYCAMGLNSQTDADTCVL